MDGGVGEVELKREQDFLRKPRIERRQLGSKEVTLQDCLKEVAKAVVESPLWAPHRVGAEQMCAEWVSVSPAVENMLLGMDKEVWDITDTSRDIGHTQGEWELLGINKATPKMSVGTNLYDQIIFYVSSEALAFSFLACL